MKDLRCRRFSHKSRITHENEINKLSENERRIKMEIKTNGGVASPKGFMAAGIEAAVKYQNRKDIKHLLLITMSCPALCLWVNRSIR